MLISITIILLFNFEKNYSYVFMFLQNFKISFPSVLTVYFVLFLRENGEKNLTINFNIFCLHAVADLRRIPRIAIARCSREAMFEVVQHHYIKIYQASFCYVMSNLSPLKICKNYG